MPESRDGVRDLKDELLDEAEEQLERNRRYRRRPGRGNQTVRQEVLRELKALKAIEDRAGRVRDPEVRCLVRELVTDAGERGMTIGDLYEGLAGGRGVRERLENLWDNNNNNHLMYMGLVLLALLAIPQVREALRPMLGKMVDELDSVGDRVKSLVTKAKEGLEDIVAEAQFERLQDAINAEVDAGIHQEAGPEGVRE